MSDSARPPYRLNLALSAIALLLAAVLLWGLPLLLLPRHPMMAVLFALGLALLQPFHGALVHEAVHGRLAASASVNDVLGRALAGATGVAFDVLRFGHLAHHRYTRHGLDRPDILEPGTGRLAGAVGFYGHLLGGMYLGEIVASLACLLPRRVLKSLLNRFMARPDAAVPDVRSAAQRAVARRGPIWRARIDVLAAASAYGIAFALYGRFWPLLLAAMVLRGLIISLQDNAPHYGTPALIGAPAHNGSLSPLLAPVMLNQNFHDVHHSQPDLPWTALPTTFRAQGRTYGGSYCAILLRQLRGPLKAGETREQDRVANSAGESSIRAA
jgi:fatty acid desaturase